MFEKGQSGNPNGRPKLPPELRQKVRECCPKVFDYLIGLLNNEHARHADRLRAAEILLERAYGKATQPVCGDEDASAIIVKLQGELQDWGK